MTAKRPLSTHRRLSLAVTLFMLALGAASMASAAARDVAMHGPNGTGGGDCGSNEATTTAVRAPGTDSKDTKPPAKAPATRIKPIVPVRSGGDDTSVHAPRWHSFLPGMFR